MQNKRQKLSQKDINKQITQILDLVNNMDTDILSNIGIDKNNVSATKLQTIYTPNERTLMLQQLTLAQSDHQKEMNHFLSHKGKEEVRPKTVFSGEDEKIINEIIYNAKKYDIKTITGFEDVSLYFYKQEHFSHLMTDELEVLLELINEEIKEKGNCQTNHK